MAAAAATTSLITGCCCKQRELVCAERGVLFEVPCAFFGWGGRGGGALVGVEHGVPFQVSVVASSGLLVQVLHGTAITGHGFHL